MLKNPWGYFTSRDMKKAPEGALKVSGGPAGVRTLDLGIKSPLLYQLSYRSNYQRNVGWVQGLEPWTSGTTTRRSSQLSYTHRVSSCAKALDYYGSEIAGAQGGISSFLNSPHMAGWGAHEVLERAGCRRIHADAKNTPGVMLTD